jgi:hypothetical protein
VRLNSARPKKPSSTKMGAFSHLSIEPVRSLRLSLETGPRDGCDGRHKTSYFPTAKRAAQQS